MKKVVLPVLRTIGWHGAVLISLMSPLKTNAQDSTSTPNQFKKNLVEIEGLTSLHGHAMVNLTTLFECRIFDNTSKLRFGGIQELYLNDGMYESWSFIDAKIPLVPVYASYDHCTDTEHPAVNYGGFGLKLQLADIHALRKYFLHCGIGLFYIATGTSETRKEKTELDVFCFSEPISVSKKVDFVFQGWGRFREGQDIGQAQLGLKKHDKPFIAFVGAAQWGGSHNSDMVLLFGFQREF